MTPFDFRPTYDASVADRHMAVITKARGMIHPKVEADWDEAIAMKQEAETDEPSGAVGWAVTAFCVAIMGFAIAAQILWEVAQATL